MNKLMLGLLFSLFLVSGVLSVGVFVPDTTKNVSIPVLGQSHPAIWFMDGKYNLLAGKSSEVSGDCIRGRTWDGSAWVQNDTIRTGLDCSIINQPYTVMVFDGRPNVIGQTFNDFTSLRAFSWNGTSWNRNTTLETGLLTNVTKIYSFQYIGTSLYNSTENTRIFVGYKDSGANQYWGLAEKEWNGTYWNTLYKYHSNSNPSTINWTAGAMTSYIKIGSMDYLLLTNPSWGNKLAPHYWNGTN